MRYADVIVDISLEKLDKTYQYAIPEQLAETAVVGAKVEVPFGGGNRKIEGYIMDTSDTPVFDPARTKEILSVVPGAVSLERRFIALAYWMKEHFGGTMNEALKTVLPVKQTMKQKEKKKIIRKADAEQLISAYGECMRKHQHAKHGGPEFQRPRAHEAQGHAQRADADAQRQRRDPQGNGYLPAVERGDRAEGRQHHREAR